MEMPVNPSENRSTYFVNPEEAEETARLLLQDRFVTKETGGVFPEDLDPNRVQLVLDLACGPGGWACDVARLHPQIDVIGVDTIDASVFAGVPMLLLVVAALACWIPARRSRQCRSRSS